MRNALFVLCAALLLSSTTLAQQAAAIRPGVVNPQLIGTEFLVDINITAAQKLFGLSFELRYTNTSLVDVATPASNSIIPGALLGNDVVFFSNVDEANGKIGIGISRKSDQANVSGSGAVARIKFVSLLATPNNTPIVLSLHEVAANDSLGNPVALTAKDSTMALLGLQVYPGDTNNDKIVDQNDVLPLGLNFGKTGPLRPNAAVAFTGQIVFPWTPNTATYADANGSGLVNQADVLPIGLNFGKTHSSPSIILRGGENEPRVSKSAPAHLSTAITSENDLSQEFWVEVHVEQATDLFGVALELNCSPRKSVEALTVEPAKWLGDDVIFLPHINNASGKVSLGMTRKFGQGGVDGAGMIARIKMRQTKTTGGNTTFSLENARANNSDGEKILLQVSGAAMVTAGNLGNEINLPTAFALHASSPNPLRLSSATGATMIKYDLPEPAETRVEIYNILGSHVATLVSGRRQAGRHAITWNGRDKNGLRVAGGMYLYVIKAGEFTAQRKLVLMK